MIIVNVKINETSIITRTARRMESFQSNPQYALYLCDDGRPIIHKVADGAAVLAGLMLEGVVNIDQSVKKLPLWARFSAWLINLKII
jgi:hypothetical protein